MIKTPTTLVLGAGASYPYGFPLAHELLRNVAKLRKTPDASEVVAYAADAEPHHVVEFCERLAAAQAPSVDTFLEANMDLSKIGRAAMAYELLGCNKRAAFSLVHPTFDERGRWYRKLWARLIEGAPSPEQFLENQLSVVTFNYDLSLEAFLHTCIQNFYGELDGEAALKLLNDTIPIVHTYGSLSPADVNSLSWHPTTPERGEPLLRQALQEMLIVPDEEADKAESLSRAKEILSRSARVAAIGFSFGKANVTRLTYFPAERGTGKTRIELCVFGTGKGERERAAQLVRKSWSRGHNLVSVLPKKLNGDRFLSEIVYLS